MRRALSERAGLPPSDAAPSTNPATTPPSTSKLKTHPLINHREDVLSTHSHEGGTR